MHATTPQVQTVQNVHIHALPFASCASILEHKLRAVTRLSHAMEIVQRRCEKGFFLRPLATPSMSAPVQLIHSLRGLPAWRGVKIIVGIFLEGFTEGMQHDQVVDWMTRETRIENYKWLIEGDDLFIAPRKMFTPEMMEELETLAANLERQDRAIFAVYAEVFIPY